MMAGMTERPNEREVLTNYAFHSARSQPVNLMGDPILSTGLRLYPAKGAHLERLLSTNSSMAAASKGFLIRVRAPAESASSSK